MSHINVSVSALVNEKTTPPGSTPNAVQPDSVQTVADRDLAIISAG